MKFSRERKACGGVSFYICHETQKKRVDAGIWKAVAQIGVISVFCIGMALFAFSGLCFKT